MATTDRVEYQVTTELCKIIIFCSKTLTRALKITFVLFAKISTSKLNILSHALPCFNSRLYTLISIVQALSNSLYCILISFFFRLLTKKVIKILFMAYQPVRYIDSQIFDQGFSLLDLSQNNVNLRTKP